MSLGTNFCAKVLLFLEKTLAFDEKICVSNIVLRLIILY